jgi:octanoyl-[GcvH]:protein N-octanoyltransferase
VVVEHVSAEADVTAGLQGRFAGQSRRLRDALAGLGADARIGELPGEYCAGRDSVNLGGRIKVAGIAQRAIRGAALTTAVVTVENGPALRTAIAALYGALDLEVEPSAAGTVDEVLPGIRAADVAAAVISAYAPTAAAALDDALLDRARGLAARHHVT